MLQTETERETPITEQTSTETLTVEQTSTETLTKRKTHQETRILVAGRDRAWDTNNRTD